MSQKYRQNPSIPPPFWRFTGGGRVFRQNRQNRHFRRFSTFSRTPPQVPKRRVLGPKRAQNRPKMGSQNDSKNEQKNACFLTPPPGHRFTPYIIGPGHPPGLGDSPGDPGARPWALGPGRDPPGDLAGRSGLRNGSPPGAGPRAGPRGQARARDQGPGARPGPGLGPGLEKGLDFGLKKCLIFGLIFGLFFGLFFGAILRRFWGGFGAVLGPDLASFGAIFWHSRPFFAKTFAACRLSRKNSYLRQIFFAFAEMFCWRAPVMCL